MIYSNVDIAVKTRSIGLEKRHFVAVGKERKPILIRTRPELEFKKGLNEELSIVWDERGKMHLERMSDNAFYMLLYAERENERSSKGTIKVYYNHKDNVRFLARFGQRDCIMIDVKDPSVGALIQVRTADFTKEEQTEFYVVYDWKVYKCTPKTLKKCCEDNKIEVSSALHIDELDARNENDWVTL